jgi:mRNA-degrading endonuclease RelE of RelBE toxin-antitoxin system
MPAGHHVETSSHFERDFRKLARRHPEVIEHFEHALGILATDPYNRTQSHPIKKLRGVPAGDGQYRLRFGRFRFRYDVVDRVVYLKAVALRSEATYR